MKPAICVLPLANEELVSPYDMTMSHLDKNSAPDTSKNPPEVSSSSPCCGLDELKDSLTQLIQEERESRGWYGEMVKILNQLVQENKEVASVQAEMLKVLRATSDQGEQQLNHLQSMARHQSLLVENHQALLLQVSRIATTLQDSAKKQSK